MTNKITWDNVKSELDAICPTNWEAIDFDTSVVGALLENRDRLGQARYENLVEKLDDSDDTTKIVTIFGVLRAVGKTLEIQPALSTSFRPFSISDLTQSGLCESDQDKMDEMFLIGQIIYRLALNRTRLDDVTVNKLIDRLTHRTGDQLDTVFEALKLLDEQLLIVPIQSLSKHSSGLAFNEETKASDNISVHGKLQSEGVLH